MNAARHKLGSPQAPAFNITADSADQAFPHLGLPLEEGHPESSSALEGLGLFDPVQHGGLLVSWKLLAHKLLNRDHRAVNMCQHLFFWQLMAAA